MSDTMRTLTEDQAFRRLDEHIRKALARIKFHPVLVPGLVGSMPCDDPADGGPPGRVFVEAHYTLSGVPVEANQDVFDLLHDFWIGEGYVVISDLRGRGRAPHLKVRQPDDGFSVALRENLASELRLSGSSPCVWPEGVPPTPGSDNGNEA